MPAEEVRAWLDEGRAFADGIGDARAGLVLSILFTRALCGAGDVAGYVELARENLRAAEAMGDVVLQANACGYLADALRIAGCFDETIALAADADARYPGDVPREMWLIGISPRVLVLYGYAIGLSMNGRVHEARAAYDRLRLLEQESSTEVEAYIETDKAQLSCFCGDAERALVHARACAERTSSLGNIGLLGLVMLRGFSWAHLSAERYEVALAFARDYLDAAAVIERTGARIFTPMLCEWRAELAAVLGDDAGRVQLLSEAREHFERMGVPLQVARLTALLPT